MPEPSEREVSSAGRLGWWALRVVVVLGLLGLAVFWVDLTALEELIRSLPPAVVLWVFACGSATRLVIAGRWSLVARGLMPGGPGPWVLFRLGLLAEFVNLWIPSSLGAEAVRILGVSGYGDLPRATVSVGLDRLLGIAGLVLSLVPLVFLVTLPFPGWVVPSAVLLVAVGVAVGLALRHRLVGRAGWADALASLSEARILGALALSACAPWLIVLGYHGFFSTVHPLPLGAVAAFVLVTRFGRAIPVSVLGMNSVEGSMLLLGELFGVPSEVVALAVALNFTDKLVHALAGGVLELLRGGSEGLRALAERRE